MKERAKRRRRRCKRKGGPSEGRGRTNGRKGIIIGKFKKRKGSSAGREGWEGPR